MAWVLWKYLSLLALWGKYILAVLCCGTKFGRNRNRKRTFGPRNLWSGLRITLTLLDVIITTLQVKKMQPKEIKQLGQVYIATWHRHSQTQGPQMPTLVLVQLECSVNSPTLNFSTRLWSESMKTLMLWSGICESTGVPNMPVASKYLLHRCIIIFQMYINGLIAS